MNIKEPLDAAIRSLRANKLRSALTALGIIIGVAAVIVVISLIQGLEKSVLKEVESAGSQTLFVRTRFKGETPPEEWNRIRNRDLTLEHMRALKEDLPIVTQVTPLFFTGAQVKWSGKSTTTQILMTDDTYLDLNGLNLSSGRNFVPADIRLGTKVCILGSSLITKLNIKGNPIGQIISTDTLSLEVIGVRETQGSSLGNDPDDQILIPLSTGLPILPEITRRQLFFQAKIDPSFNADDGAELVEDSLRRIKGIKSGEPNSFRVFSSKQITALVGNITALITSVAGGMVSIALLVGGIGIMNIMLVSVTERTREIGVRKAVGAKRKDILTQFLIEASLLCVLGGAVGILLGYALGAGVGILLLGEMGGIPLWSVISAFVVPAAIGVIFGMYPANKASKMDPIEALRYE